MPETEFQAFLAAYSPEVQQIAEAARSLILEAIPGALELVDPPSKIVAYGFNRSYAGLICALAPTKAYVNLMFSRGVELPDPEGLLQGTGKRARHARLASLSDLQQPGVRSLLQAAADLAR